MRARRVRTYLVGRFEYSVPRRQRGIAAARREDVDTLPPTMRDLAYVRATSKAAAIAIYRAARP